MKRITMMKMERAFCTAGVVMCAVCSILSILMMDWMAVVASMVTMMVCEVAYQLVNKQVEGAQDNE